MTKFIFVLLFLTSILSASEIKLKEKLGLAKPGSYLVIEQNKTFTLLHIHALSASSVVLEEVSIPAANFSKESMKWKEWFEKGSPGHTSWIMSQINLKTGVFEETFSFTHRGWIDMKESDPFFTTLLNLSFKEIPDTQRRRVGLPPGYNKVDRRPLWNPRLIVDGHTLPNTLFSAYKARWPADGTELSRKVVEIYLPDSQLSSENNGLYPIYFPYWLEVDGKFGSAKVRVVDSGVNAHSPKKCLPKCPPQMIGDAKLNESGLSFHLKSPPYYRDFIILAEESNAFFGNTLPLPCKTSTDENGVVSLFISKEELKILADQGSSFRFVISPKEDPSITLRSSLITFKS